MSPIPTASPLFPTASLRPLNRSDGSSTFTHPITHTDLLFSINGPLELHRTKDLVTSHSSAILEIIIRPSVGVPSYREKWLEEKLKEALSSILCLEMFPGKMIQVVGQVISTGELVGLGKNGKRDRGGFRTETGGDYTPISLLQGMITAAMLALLDAGVPAVDILDTTVVAVVDFPGQEETKMVVNPTSENLVIQTSPDGMKEKAYVRSVHVFCYTAATTELVLAESEGEFTYEQWEDCCKVVEESCFGEGDQSEAEGNERPKSGKGKGGVMAQLIRKTVSEKVERDLRWRK